MNTVTEEIVARCYSAFVNAKVMDPGDTRTRLGIALSAVAPLLTAAPAAAAPKHWRRVHPTNALIALRAIDDRDNAIAEEAFMSLKDFIEDEIAVAAALEKHATGSR